MVEAAAGQQVARLVRVARAQPVHHAVRVLLRARRLQEPVRVAVHDSVTGVDGQVLDARGLHAIDELLRFAVQLIVLRVRVARGRVSVSARVVAERELGAGQLARPNQEEQQQRQQEEAADRDERRAYNEDRRQGRAHVQADGGALLAALILHREHVLALVAQLGIEQAQLGLEAGGRAREGRLAPLQTLQWVNQEALLDGQLLLLVLVARCRLLLRAGARWRRRVRGARPTTKGIEEQAHKRVAGRGAGRW